MCYWVAGVRACQKSVRPLRPMLLVGHTKAWCCVYLSHTYGGHLIVKSDPCCVCRRCGRVREAQALCPLAQPGGAPCCRAGCAGHGAGWVKLCLPLHLHALQHAMQAYACAKCSFKITIGNLTLMCDTQVAAKAARRGWRGGVWVDRPLSEPLLPAPPQLPPTVSQAEVRGHSTLSVRLFVITRSARDHS